MATFYAWARIKAGNKSANYGDSVTPGKLGIDKEQFEAHIVSGAIRTARPPEIPDTWQGSPNNWIRHQLQEQANAAEASLQAFDLGEIEEEEEEEE